MIPFIQNSWFGFRWRNEQSSYRDKTLNIENFLENSHVFATSVNQDSDLKNKNDVFRTNTFFGKAKL